MLTIAPSIPDPLAAGSAQDDPLLLSPFSRWIGSEGELLAGPGPAALAESQFQLSGLHCAACAAIIERALSQVPGVMGATVNAASARLKLRWDPRRSSLADVIGAVEHVGYGVAPDTAASARVLREQEHRQALWRLFVAAFLMMQVMMMAAPAYFAPPDDLSPDLARLLQWASWVMSLPVLLFSAGPFFSRAYQQLRARRLGMDVPVVLGLAVTFIASSAALFEPGGIFGHEVYFDSLTMFVTFLLAGRFLELRARHRAAVTLECASAALPESVERLAADGRSSQVAPARLAVGDRVRVCAGQAFPADGVVEAGSSAANEALLSGESEPVPKQQGDEVVAASLNLQAPLVMRVLRVGADTRHEGIKRLMREAMTQRPSALLFADRFAGCFLWAVLLLAALGAGLWSWVDPSKAVWVAVSVLIVTCPCALSLATPASWLAATSALAKRGLLLVRLDLLESLCRIDTVVLDKTGTLTEDRMVLLQSWVEGVPVEQQSALLAQARSLARHSQHPFSRALAGEGLQADASEWLEVQEFAGLGLQARDARGQVLRLGRPDWVLRQHASQPVGLNAQLCFGGAGAVLHLRFGEVLRADAREAVARLHALGLRTVLLSGDSQARVARLAAEAGIQSAQGGANPDAKLAAVAALQAQGRCVLMVGDGINDAPVLALADASVVMGQGAMLARATADALLLSGRLSDLAAARELALRTQRVIRQNLAWSAVYNFACIPLALAGFLPPWAAGLGMAASSVFVVLNAQRLALSAEPT